jgi:hypothetical protein
MSKTVGFEILRADPTRAAKLIYDDFTHFLALDEIDQKKIYTLIKRITPPPEFKEQFRWAVEGMKEELDSNDPLTVDEWNGQAKIRPRVEQDADIATFDPNFIAAWLDVEIQKIARVPKSNVYQRWRATAYREILKFVEGEEQ